MILKLIKFLAVCLLLATPVLGSPGGFLFVTFRNEGGAMSEQMYFAISQDGQNWQALNGGRPVLVSHIGEKGARDPYVFRAHDGAKFYVIATDLSIHFHPDWGRSVRGGSHSILVWESSDLVNWSPPRLVAVAPSDAGCTWAPEAIYDDATGDYLVYWASTTASDHFAKQRIWACRTKDFITFGQPFIYIDRATAVIDADIVKDGSHYYRFAKDEARKAITMETSDQLTGTWSKVPGFTLANLQGYEGPECYQLATGGWCLIADHYAAGSGYTPFVTANLASGAFTASAGFHFPFAFRHGAVLPLTAAEYSRLDSAFPAPAPGGNHEWQGTLLDGSLRVATQGAGQGGKTVALNGVGDYVSLPAGVASALGDFTIATWIKMNSLDRWVRIFDFGAGPEASMFLTPQSGAGAVRFAISNAGIPGQQVINGTSALSVGDWTHVAVTLHDHVGILYVNGVEVGRNSAVQLTPAALGFTTHNFLGRSQFPADPYFNGLIGDFQIRTAALSPDSIQMLYTNSAGPWRSL